MLPPPLQDQPVVPLPQVTPVYSGPRIQFGARLLWDIHNTTFETTKDLVNTFVVNTLVRGPAYYVSEFMREFADQVYETKDSVYEYYNRHPGILCGTEGRPRQCGEYVEYIHGNKIDYTGNVMAVQCPLPEVIYPFWKTALYGGYSKIISLNDLSENVRVPKPFHPRDPEECIDTDKFEFIFRERRDHPEIPGIEVTTFEVREKVIPIWHSSSHIHYDRWERMDLPPLDSAICSLLFELTGGERHMVLSSAGIGRAGTYGLVYYILHSIMTLKPFTEPFRLLRLMRNYRYHAVETAAQYAYTLLDVGVYARLRGLLKEDGLKVLEKYETEMRDIRDAKMEAELRTVNSEQRDIEKTADSQVKKI